MLDPAQDPTALLSAAPGMPVDNPMVGAPGQPALTEDDEKQAVEVLKQLRDAAVALRKPFIETRDEVRKYAYEKTFDFIYTEHDSDLFFKAKIAKAAEFLEIMGAALYPSNPEAAVNSLEFATPTQRVRHKTEKQYTDYSWRHGQMVDHGSRMVHDALLGGCGVLWTGYNTRKGVVQSVHDTIDNLLLDPDAKNKEELNWIGRRRLKPRWMLAKMYQQKADAIQRLEKFADANSNKHSGKTSSDLVEYFEFYFKVGLGNYAVTHDGQSPNTAATIFAQDTPLKFCWAEGVLLAVEEWEIPFHQADLWPAEWYCPLETPGRLWPSAPMETGLGHLKALNWIYTLYLSKMRVTTRTPLVVANINGQGLDDKSLVALLKGKDLDIIRVTINGDVLKLSDLVQQFKFDTGVEEFERFASIVSQAFEKATGLYEVLYTGTTPTQIRNAATADMIRNSSTSRVNNMQVRMEQFMGRVAFKTMFAARFLETPDDIALKFGPDAGSTWGTLAPPELVQQEQMVRAQTKQKLVQSLTMPAAPPMPGMLPPPPMPPAEAEAQAEIQIGPEQLVAMETWMNEASRDIEAGSMRPMTPQAQVDNLNVALNQLAPAVVNLPGGAEFVANIAVEFARLNKYSLEFIESAKKFAAQAAQVTDHQVAMALAPPPAPMPGGPGNEPTPPKGPQSGPEGGRPTI